jgi:hypothetical protein
MVCRNGAAGLPGAANAGVPFGNSLCKNKFSRYPFAPRKLARMVGPSSSHNIG